MSNPLALMPAGTYADLNDDTITIHLPDGWRICRAFDAPHDQIAVWLERADPTGGTISYAGFVEDVIRGHGVAAAVIELNADAADPAQFCEDSMALVAGHAYSAAQRAVAALGQAQ